MVHGTRRGLYRVWTSEEERKHARYISQQASSSHNCTGATTIQAINEPTRPSKRQRISRVCSGQMTAAAAAAMVIVATKSQFLFPDFSRKPPQVPKKWRESIFTGAEPKNSRVIKLLKHFGPGQNYSPLSLALMAGRPCACAARKRQQNEREKRFQEPAHQPNNPSADETPGVEFFSGCSGSAKRKVNKLINCELIEN